MPFELSCEELLVIRYFYSMTGTEVQLALALGADLIVAVVLRWLPVPGLLDSVYQHAIVNQAFPSRIRIDSGRNLFTRLLFVIKAFV